MQSHTPYDYHTPIMLNECLQMLNIKPNGVYVDLTLGGGGHTLAIANTLTTGKIYAFDQDADAIERFNNVYSDFLHKVQPIHANSRFFTKFLRLNGVNKVDGILADLGVSSHQFDTAERGFSYRFNAHLDMRMNMQSSITAGHILNHYSEQELTKIFANYGECKQARSLSLAVIRARAKQAIDTTFQLVEICKPFTKKFDEYKLYGQVFQALRIAVNDELGALEDILSQSCSALNTGGVFAVITFHSLEDRLVKNFFKHGKLYGEAEKDVFGNVIVPFKPLSSKPIEPSAHELNNNSRARSAKLRAAIRL